MTGIELWVHNTIVLFNWPVGNTPKIYFLLLDLDFHREQLIFFLRFRIVSFRFRIVSFRFRIVSLNLEFYLFDLELYIPDLEVYPLDLELYLFKFIIICSCWDGFLIYLYHQLVISNILKRNCSFLQYKVVNSFFKCLYI